MQSKKGARQASAKARKTGMARLLELAATKKPFIICAVLLASIASIASFIPYIAIFRIISILLENLSNIAAVDAAELTKYGLYALGGAVLNIVLYFLALACSHLAAFGTLYELKVNFASHLARVPLGLHITVGSGKLRKIMDENIEKVEEFIAHQLPDIVAAFVAPVVMVAILLAVDWRMGLAALVGVVISFAVQVLSYGKDGAAAQMKKYQAASEDMNNASVEYVRGISVVKAFKQTVYSFRKLHDTIQYYTKITIEYTMMWANTFPAFTSLINNIYLFVVPVAIFIGMYTTDYASFASAFIFYLLFVPAAATVLMKTMYVNSSGMRILTGVEAMDEILDKPELKQPLAPKTVKTFDVKFEDVVFAYDDAEDTTALNGVSFTAPQGEITAIVGPSGGGKSTVAHLIPRFFDVTGGCITIGGTDVREMETSYLMNQVSFVFQDVFLFKQSVRENIMMANTEATEEQVIAAAKAAQCHEFIMKLPSGYDTVIGTRGIHLSGGEKQRLAIARAIVKDAPIVVLDEATAFSDPENEHLIQMAFKELMQNKTVIMIAHRLSTIRSADKIVVISDGRVIEQGTHDALLKQAGRYADMWETYNHTVSWSMTKKAKEGAQHA